MEQLENGSVTLWFETGSAENWNSDMLTCSDGVNSVTVTGCTDVTLRLGNTAGLDLPGAFDVAASEKIFEEKNKGFIA